MAYSEIVLIAFILLVVFAAVQMKRFVDFLRGCSEGMVDKSIAPRTVLANPAQSGGVSIEKDSSQVKTVSKAQVVKKSTVKTKKKSAEKAPLRKQKPVETPKRKSK